MPDQNIDATRQLMAGVHLDARFRDAVIDELYEHPERVAAPAYDFDAVPVLLEALRARRTARLWALPVALLWIAGFVLLGWLFAVYAVGALALLGAARVLGDRAAPLPTAVVARRPPPTRPARIWGGVLRGFGRVMLVLYAIPVVGSVWVGDPGPWGVPPVVVAFPLAVLMTLMTAGHRASVVERLTEVQSSPRPRPPGASPARLDRALHRVTQEQGSRIVVHPPGAPFTGSGTSLNAECVTVRLRPTNRLDLERFLGRSLLDRVKGAVEGVPGLAQQVDHRLFLADDDLPHPDPAHLPLDMDRLLDSALGRPGWRPRTGPGTEMLRIVCRGPRSQLTTVFVRLRLDAPYFSVELHTYVLPPVRADFAAAGRRQGWQPVGHPFLPLSPNKSLSLAILRTPSAGAGVLAEPAAWPVRRLRAVARLDVLRATGPGVSIRELAAERRLSEPELLDSRRIAATVRQLVLDTVRDTLAAAGLSAPDHREEESFGIRGGIQLGNMTGGAVVAGRDHGGIQFGHTSPGPTTNPDDDSWDDDLG